MIFESLNSTGLDLTPADLIRNFVLMRLRVAVPAVFQAPIYSWLGPYWLDGEQWANGLNVAETRAFVAFVSCAWAENWPCPRIKEMVLEPFTDESRFRDFGLHKALASSVRRRVKGWQKPCVFRQWA
jgi:hypothetical protein